MPVLLSALIVGLTLTWAVGKVAHLNANPSAFHLFVRALAPTGQPCTELVAQHAESVAFNDSSLEVVTATLDERFYSEVPKWCREDAVEALRNVQPKIVLHIK